MQIKLIYIGVPFQGRIELLGGKLLRMDPFYIIKTSKGSRAKGSRARGSRSSPWNILV